jgi:dynein heavy chain, axonemal
MDIKNNYQSKQSLDSGLVEFEWESVNVAFNDDDQPKPSCGHSLTIVGSQAYMFGGMIGFGRQDLAAHHDEDLESYPSNVLYRLDYRASTMTWMKLNPRPSNNNASQPLPRWKHSATALGKDRILIFGGYHSTSHRLNDLWIYDISEDSWSQPNSQHNMEASIKNQLSFNAWPNAPSPRAGHSATVIGDHLIVFGGYGGLGYSRRDLDDLYSLNIKNMEWTKILAKGSPPERRSCHQACAVGKKIFIIGGTSTSTQYQDIYVLDLEYEPTWSKLTTSFPQPLWNHTAAVAVAVPNHKIFSFGGIMGALTDQNRLGISTSILSVMDVGTKQWTGIACSGSIPEARCDSSMVYDAESSRLILFGGWSDFWLNDVHVLNVGQVVGPPYTILSLSPSFGAVTGGTEIIITGIDFVNVEDIVVRFGNSDQAGSYIDVPGTFLSTSSISCISPSLPKSVNRSVAVRVSFNHLPFTNSKHMFSIFSVTSAQNSVAFGVGLLSGCLVGEEVNFYIQARDFNGSDRYTGGDEFIVEIVSVSGQDAEKEEPVRALVEDQGDGKYLVSYSVQRSGRYKVNMEFLGTYGGKAGPLRGSGVELTFVNATLASDKTTNTMLGDLVIRSLKNDANFLVRTMTELSKVLFVKLNEDTWSAEDHIRVLISVKEAIVRVENNKEEIQLILDRSECCLRFFQGRDMPFSSLEDEIISSKRLWERIKVEAPPLLSRTTTMMRIYVSKIKSDISNYESHVKTYLEEVKKSDFYLFKTGPARAMDCLDAAELFHDQQAAVCDKMTNVAKVFEIAEDIDVSRALIDEISTILHNYRVLWETYVHILVLIEEANSMPWINLDPDMVEETSKSLLSSIRKLPKMIKSSDAYSGLEKLVKEFVTTCPLIMALRSPSMRPRHWNELMIVVNRQFEVPSAKSSIRLADLLKLGFHEKESEVEEITEKAAKEAKHEEILSSLEGMWSTAMFSMTLYKDTNIPLIRLDDEVIEQLESDQMAVQSILGSRFPHFKRKALEWQQYLAVISDVTQLLAEIQHTWAYLEPLFIHSEEVQKELPEDTKQFNLVNEHVQVILQRAWTVKIVKEICMRRGLLESLSDLQKQQEACKKSLTEYLDGKRTKFPRFYFISEADLLDILSNSTQPEKVLRHVSHRERRYSNQILMPVVRL